MDIVVKAKVLRVEDEHLTMYDNGTAPAEREYIWGNMSIPVDEVRYYWNHSKNRCVIELKNGRLIIVDGSFEKLKENIDEVRQQQMEQLIKEIEEEDENSDEEDLILGEKEDDEEDD